MVIQYIKVMKGGNLQPRTLYSTKLPYRFDGEVKVLQKKESWKGPAPPTSFERTVLDFSK